MLVILLIVALVGLDQITKVLAVQYLSDGHSIEIIKNFFSLTYTQNTGAAFGVFQNGRLFFLILSIPVVLAMLYLVFRFYQRLSLLYRLSLAFIIAGAIGNMIDRAFIGHVRDFFYVSAINFPVFNVADSCITVGAVLMIFGIIFTKDKSLDITRKE